MLTFQDAMKTRGIDGIESLHVYLSAFDPHELSASIYRPVEAFADDSPFKIVENTWLAGYRGLEYIIHEHNSILERLSKAWSGTTADHVHKELQAWIDKTAEVKDYVKEIYSTMTLWGSLWQRVQNSMIAPKHIPVTPDAHNAAAYEQARTVNITALCDYYHDLSGVAERLEKIASEYLSLPPARSVKNSRNRAT